MSKPSDDDDCSGGADVRSIGYAELVRSALACPGPPVPPAPPLPPPPNDAPRIDFVRAPAFWRVGTGLVVGAVAVGSVISGGSRVAPGMLSGLLSWAAIAGFVALLIVPGLWGRRAERSTRRWWQARAAYDSAFASAQAVSVQARKRAEASWRAAHYCHGCMVCFWAVPQSQALSPAQFRGELTGQGGYARLGQQYEFAYRALRPQTAVTQVTIGDIVVSGRSIATPSGVIAASGAEWRSWEVHTESRRVTPAWAIALAVTFSPLCGLGLLLLRIKQDESVLHLGVSVQNANVLHKTQVRTSGLPERRLLESKLDYARLSSWSI